MNLHRRFVAALPLDMSGGMVLEMMVVVTTQNILELTWFGTGMLRWRAWSVAGKDWMEETPFPVE